jgi:predicted DNA-binding transcriptional regulator AlpA
MKKGTRDVIKSVINGDPSVNADDRTRLLRLVREGGLDAADDPLLRDRLIRRAEVARLLGRSVSSVDRLVKDGVLANVVFLGRLRAAGFRLSDVAALIEGGK